ncbi:MAG: CbtA family protein [Rhodospirillales bacterium]
MINRVLTACLAAGLLAGLAGAVLQEFTTTPMILAAEKYETAAVAPSSAFSAMQYGEAKLYLAHSGSHDAPADGAEPWSPEDGLERLGYTTLTSIATAFGFALMLLAVMLVSNARITPRTGLAWGAAAFVATGLAPALGLSPELPGSAAAMLEHRQIWWLATVTLTAGGLWLMLVLSRSWSIALGIVLIALPHIVGAPHPETYTSAVPSELAGHFSAASLAVHAVIWAVVGSVIGFMWNRGESDPAVA